jgi:CubicO group peptidase (beta-lactamase class C family)
LKQLTIIILATALAFSSSAQQEGSIDLNSAIIEADSLLFDVGFNRCDIQLLDTLISEEFSFYHDQSGITESKDEFIRSVENGLCKLPYKALRVMDEEDSSVFPMRKDGEIYGAIQHGEHRFYALENNQQKFLTSIAQFTHVWVIENHAWKLRTVLSYDHYELVKKGSESGRFVDDEATSNWLKEQNIPAIAIGYIDQGKVIQTSVFGELEAGKKAPLNAVWNVASLTKPVTALIALKFVDAGEWDLDEPISNYYMENELKSDSRYGLLTTRMILSHQSGLPNWRGEQGALRFEFTPGERFQYSGEGYDLLRRALELKFDKGIQTMAEELIFHPLNMHSTSFQWTADLDEREVAQWHKESGECYHFQKFHEANGADNLMTTIDDYTAFVEYVLKGAGLSEHLQKEMHAEEVRLNDFKHFGLGWWIDENINENNDYALAHGGDDVGVHCMAFVLPGSQKGLVIFTNSDNGTAAYMELISFYLGRDAEGIFRAEMN